MANLLRFALGLTDCNWAEGSAVVALASLIFGYDLARICDAA
jgi:hypothetical protein